MLLSLWKNMMMLMLPSLFGIITGTFLPAPWRSAVECVSRVATLPTPSFEGDSYTGQRQESHEAFECGGLSGAGAAEDVRHLALSDLKADAADNVVVHEHVALRCP